MSWFKVDDCWAIHPKKLELEPAAAALWLDIGTNCARVGSEGLVSGRMLRSVRGSTTLTDHAIGQAVAQLVAAGLWHDHDTVATCRRCHRGDGTWAGVGDLEAGAFYFHDWRDYQLSKAGRMNPVARSRELRKKALHRDATLTRRVRERDRDLCRYCGEIVAFRGDRRSRRAGTYDHVDPWGENDYANVVVACRGCNSRKKDRTLAESGLELLPAPRPDQAPTKPGQVENLARSSSTKLESTREGPGRVRSGARSGSGQVDDVDPTEAAP